MLGAAEHRCEVAAACGLALDGGDDRSEAVVGHALEPETTLGNAVPRVDSHLVGTPIRLALGTVSASE